MEKYICDILSLQLDYKFEIEVAYHMGFKFYRNWGNRIIVKHLRSSLWDHGLYLSWQMEILEWKIEELYSQLFLRRQFRSRNNSVKLIWQLNKMEWNTFSSFLFLFHMKTFKTYFWEIYCEKIFWMKWIGNFFFPLWFLKERGKPASMEGEFGYGDLNRIQKSK